MSLSLVPYLAAYIPRDRVESILSKRPLSHDGVALIADISGFTKLTEALTKNLQADQGAEELTRALESVFEPLIEEVHQFQGSVIKFGGDALIVWFGREKRQRRKTVLNMALTSALRMQDVMEKHGRIQTPIGPVYLQMKIGLAYGPVKRVNLGQGDVGFEDVLAGNTLDLMADAEHHAEPGDIVISPNSLPLIIDQITIKEMRDGYPILAAVKKVSKPKPWPAIKWENTQTDEFADELASYVPEQIYDQLRVNVSRIAELRPVVSLFVQFHGLSYDDDPQINEKLQQFFTTSQEIVSRYNGRLNRLITGDKGSMLHIIFGAPRTVEEQETRALRCALELQDAAQALAFISMQRIGIAAGRVFAGPVGSDVRHDYTTMGDTINLSARLMQNAGDNQILVETAVTKQTKTIVSEKLPPILVKGKADPIPVSVVQSYSQPSHSYRETPQVFGRENERDFIKTQLDKLTHGQGSISMVIGEVGLGKSLFLDNIRAEMETSWFPREDGGILASGLSVAYGESISGYLFIDLLRDLIDIQPGAGPDTARRRLVEFCSELFGEHRLEATYPYLARFMNLPLTDAAAQRLDGLGGESLRWQIFELIPELFEKITSQFPLILMFDDLQWSDPTSLQLIERILPLTENRPLMLILATRPASFTFSDHPHLH
ncbi:MAG: adenylate/guanylate cyclase domain-containing protein, partial [Chloroflexota bacterium]